MARIVNITVSDPPLSNSTQQNIKAWTAGECYQLTASTYDSTGCLSIGTVVWPDGSAGTFTTTTKNSTFNVVDAFTVTHTNSGLTATQALVTRDTSGNVTVKPAITIA